MSRSFHVLDRISRRAKIAEISQFVVPVDKIQDSISLEKLKLLEQTKDFKLYDQELEEILNEIDPWHKILDGIQAIHELSKEIERKRRTGESFNGLIWSVNFEGIVKDLKAIEETLIQAKDLCDYFRIELNN
ncbi:hypothetical protein H6F67_06385 [Microcoleus sp. FACHB-1515]|uniref:hypothetical protein n=1 Tax=Cyanophyceae TaxID=3028117 RepID=UPI001685D2FB|nr:hypothetical protein [Microcoleus sp. FACHB-1515]MBD2089479.1 hypothetical protein [Microcoleus sp. FACHB-1515]